MASPPKGIARGIAHHRVTFIGLEIAIEIEIDFPFLAFPFIQGFSNHNCILYGGPLYSNFDPDFDFDFDYPNKGGHR